MPGPWVKDCWPQELGGVRLQCREAREKHASALGYGEEQKHPRHFEERMEKDSETGSVVCRGGCICYSSLSTTGTDAYLQKTKHKTPQ